MGSNGDYTIDTCPGCGGSGRWYGSSYVHNGGLCFKCRGTGRARVLTETAKAEREARKQAKREARERLWARERAERLAACPWAMGVALLAASAPQGSFAARFANEMLYKIARGWGLSDKQAALLFRLGLEVQRGPVAEAPSAYVGNVGERLELDVEFLGVRWIDTQFGLLGIHRFRDEAGNVLVWATRSGRLDKPEGAKLRIRGTVTEHKEYRGRKETKLSRVMVVGA